MKRHFVIMLLLGMVVLSGIVSCHAESQSEIKKRVKELEELRKEREPFRKARKKKAEIERESDRILKAADKSGRIKILLQSYTKQEFEEMYTSFTNACCVYEHVPILKKDFLASLPVEIRTRKSVPNRVEGTRTYYGTKSAQEMIDERFIATKREFIALMLMGYDFSSLFTSSMSAAKAKMGASKIKPSPSLVVPKIKCRGGLIEGKRWTGRWGIM